jgi:hypothetical protein
MTRSMKGRPLPGLPYLAQLRTRLRYAEYTGIPNRAWDTGGCAVVSEVIAVRYGVTEDGGCYVGVVNGYDQHISHHWNVLPDGRILDVTADQFQDEDLPYGIRITDGADERYESMCDGDTCMAI